VNTSVSSTQRDSQPLEADSNVTNTAELESASDSTSCQRPSLTLSHTVARSETLESPAYVPIDFSVLPNDVTATHVTDVIISGMQQVGADVESKNGVQTTNDTPQSASAVASISIETETPAVMSSVSPYEKLMPAQQATAGKTSKFAAVRHRFTVSKTVLPSSAAPPVVVFSKLAAESDNPCEVQSADDVGRVHIVDKAQSSDGTAVNKSTVSEVDSSHSSVDVSPASETVTDVLTSSASTLASTVIMTDELCADEADGDEVSQVDDEAGECRQQSTDVQVVACGENIDGRESDSRCDESTDENAQMHSSLCVHRSEVTAGSCAARNCVDVETSILPCESGCQVSCEDGSLHRDAADLHETTTAGDKCGIVPASALQESCPTAVSYTASGRGSELQCTTDELPFSDASDDILVAQVTDSVASCSTVQQITASVPPAVSSLLCSKHDALQQNEQCDNSSQTAESLPSATAAQRSSPMQDETDDKC